MPPHAQALGPLSSARRFRQIGMTATFTSTSYVFPSVGPDYSFERLTERSVGLVTDQPSNIDELLVTLFE